MSTSNIIANMSRGWNRNPESAITSAREGVSAALWTGGDEGVAEVTADPDPMRAIISLMLSRFEGEDIFDGRISYAGPHRPGMVNLVSPGLRPRGVIRGAFKVMHIYLPARMIAMFAEMEIVGSARPELMDPRCAVDPVVARIGGEILREMQEGRPLSRLRVDVLGQDLTIHMLRRWSNMAGASACAGSWVKGGLAPWQARRATDYLKARVAEDVSLDDLARLFDLSPYHFCRAFKRSTGLPPHRYQLWLRIEAAKALLAETDLSIGGVAARVGYDDPNQLARVFRKALGVSPSQYRRERRR